MDQVYNLTQAYSQAPWRKQRQVIGLFLTVLVFAGLIAGIYLNVTARSATIGREIQRLQVQIEEAERINANLHSELAFLTSAAEMEKRARNMGFQPIEKDESWFIIVPEYTDRQPAILAPAPSPVPGGVPEMPPEYTESLFEWLRKQMLASAIPWFPKVLP